MREIGGFSPVSLEMFMHRSTRTNPQEFPIASQIQTDQGSRTLNVSWFFLPDAPVRGL
jgi:hypothetical protein